MMRGQRMKKGEKNFDASLREGQEASARRMLWRDFHDGARKAR